MPTLQEPPRDPGLTPNQVAARLDRLPVGPFHHRFLALVSLGAWFDYYDNFVATTLVVLLSRAGVVPKARPGEWVSAEGLFMAALPLGMFVGTIVFGLASDYVGRRLGFVLMLLLYSLTALVGGAGYYPLEAAAGPAAAFALLLVSRALAGAGIGAENVIIDAYISEVVPRQVRGRSIALTHAVAFTALPVVALLGWLLVPPESPQNWWLLLVIGSLGALLAWYFRRRLPESPRWLASRGRGQEAEAVLNEIEAAVRAEGGGELPPAETPPARRPPRRTPFREIWSRRYRGRTVLLVVFHLLQTVGYYGFMHWLGKLLDEKGFNTDEIQKMQLAASLLAPVGPLLGMWSSDRWQRKWLLVALALLVGLAQLGFWLAGAAVLLTTLAGLIIVGLNWFSALFHTYHAELFPTEARATGVGFTYAWSRASMVGLNLVMPGLMAASLAGAFGLMAGALFAVAAILAVFGPLTNARPLEELSSES
jgi:putative MFS transporter